MMRATGAPFDQGCEQGSAHAAAIASSLRELRARHGVLGWSRTLRAARRSTGRPLECYLPQQHERLQGIARGAGARLAALEALDASERISGVGGACKAELAASFDPAACASPLFLRESRPDAGGSGSLELSASAWAGCLAGVNGQGLAVVCVEDQDRASPSLRLLTQDFLFRGRELDAAIEHLRLRASYLGSSGVLLVSDAAGRARRLELRQGALHCRDAPERADLGEMPTVRLDPRSRTLRWRPHGDSRVTEARLD